MADCTCDPWGACGPCLDAMLEANWEGVPVVDPSGQTIGKVIAAEIVTEPPEKRRWFSRG